MDIQTKKKQKKTVDCKKTVAKVKKEKGKKQKREKNQKKRYRGAGCSRHQAPQTVWKKGKIKGKKRYRCAGCSRHQAPQTGLEKIKKRKKRDTDALDAVATKHHRRFRKRKGIGLDTHAQKSAP